MIQNLFFIPILLISLGLVSCSSSQESLSPKVSTESLRGDQETPQAQKKVLTTFTILADMAQVVAGEQLTVESITKIGAEIHGYEPTPSDLVKAQEADLILYNGMGLERWFERFLGNVKDVPSVTLTAGIDPISIAEGPYTNKPNPHAWMSPKNALIYVENIRKAFVALDPENATIYNANAEAYGKQIQELGQQLQQDLEQVPQNQRVLVSCEGAFSYLTRDYDLKEIYIWPINAEQQFTPKQVQRVIEKVKADNVPTVFCESTVSSEGQKQVAKSSGARFGGNLYVDSLSAPDGAVPTFLELLDYDIRTITTGLSTARDG